VIQDARVKALNARQGRDGAYVLYWMQQSHRAWFNPALEYAIAAANARRLPVVVGFGLMDDYPEANLRHYAFMLEGLQDVARGLAERGIGFVIRHGAPPEVALGLAADAALVVCDRGYLRHQRQWREAVAGRAPCPVVQIEGDVVVPVEVASGKAETAARTLRPKLHRARDDYLVELDEQTVETAADPGLQSDFDLDDVDAILDRLELDRSVKPVRRFGGGTSEARRRLHGFVDEKLPDYADGRSEPAAYQCSLLSPYLHFGQISPVEIALEARRSRFAGDADRAAFLEELIVRRELSINFVACHRDYDSYRGLPDWAQKTLAEHRADDRARRYRLAELEAAKTHDPYWNAAMREMVHTGFMHNYMRMYWGKKILEWSDTPEAAYRTTLHLNNKYFLDGRDPNSYANVAWIFGLHDRPWPERPVFGKVRYMNANGLRRKFDMDAYIAAVDQLVVAEME